MPIVVWDEYRKYAEAWELGHATEKLQELFELVTRSTVVLVVRGEQVSEVPLPILNRAIVILV
jgi:hypothetical protein